VGSLRLSTEETTMPDKKIYVTKPFKLRLTKDNEIDFKSGFHTVSEEVADHWYVKAHLGDEPTDVANIVELVRRAEDAEAQATKLAEELVQVQEAAAKALAEKDAEIEALKRALAGAKGDGKKPAEGGQPWAKKDL